jgi:hypothetical protein
MDVPAALPLPCSYQRGSEMCEKLAQSLHHLTSIEERELFDFGSRGGDGDPVMLILDRRDDPVTPLLSQVRRAAPRCWGWHPSFWARRGLLS